MMEKDQLRKADIFSGTLILILGLFIISQGLQMPMKDSWGGVQNVWFVSPALFPLFVGSTLSLLGGILISIAFKSVGMEGMKSVFSFLGSSEFRRFLQEKKTVRFYGVVFNLLVFVFLMIPRIDFFPAAILFLLSLFFMYYLGDHQQLKKVFGFLLAAHLLLGVFLLLGLGDKVIPGVEFGGDCLVFCIIVALCVFTKLQIREQQELKRKFRLCLLIGFLAPMIVGIIFKYFLLVPMPFEGLVVQLLDAIWYAEIWS